MRTQIVKSNQCDLLENGGSQWELLIIEMNGPRYLGFSWISVSYTVTLSKIQQKGFGKRPDDAIKTCSWNLQKLSRVERSCLPTLFWPIYFLTNGSFGLSRTCIFILGCAIAFFLQSISANLENSTSVGVLLEKNFEKFVCDLTRFIWFNSYIIFDRKLSILNLSLLIASRGKIMVVSLRWVCRVVFFGQQNKPENQLK